MGAGRFPVKPATVREQGNPDTIFTRLILMSVDVLDSEGGDMRPIDSTLLAIASAKAALQPVQLQKALFLFAAKVPAEVLPATSRYQFKPYDYGPFSAEIYADAEVLEQHGLVDISRPPTSRYKEFCITPAGRAAAVTLRAHENPNVVNYLANLVAYTQSLGFNQLVASVYEEFPEMRANSVFKDVA